MLGILAPGAAEVVLRQLGVWPCLQLFSAGPVQRCSYWGGGGRGRLHRLLVPLKEGRGGWKGLDPVVTPGPSLGSLALSILSCETRLRACCQSPCCRAFPRKAVHGLQRHWGWGGVGGNGSYIRAVLISKVPVYVAS